MEKKSFNLRRKPISTKFIASAQPTMEEKIIKAINKKKSETKGAKESPVPTESKKVATQEDTNENN